MNIQTAPRARGGTTRRRRRRQAIGDRSRFPLASAAACLLVVPTSQAVIFFGTSDPNHNVIQSVSDHPLAKYVGLWGSYTGTPIAPNYFLTSQHVGLPASLTLGGASYNIAFGGEGVSYWTDSGSDLRIVKINGTFPASAIAPLYTAGTEQGQTLTVFGRGTQRGGEVNLPGASVADLRGWFWGVADQKLRWGQNVVTGFADYAVVNDQALLYARFDRSGLAEEATLSAGDSSGPVFIDGQLAGINFAVDGRWKSDAINGGTPFNAAIFDAGGLQKEELPGVFGSPLPDGAHDLPSGFYASRVSDRVAWIQGITGVPEPAEWALWVGLGLVGFASWRRRATGGSEPH